MGVELTDMAQLGTGAGVGPNLDEQLKKEAKEFEKQVDQSKVPIAEQHFACSDLRWRFKQCVMQDPCVLGGRTPSDCLSSKSISQACLDLNFSLTQCRRKKMDPRTRIKGPSRGGSDRDSRS